MNILSFKNYDEHKEKIRQQNRIGTGIILQLFSVIVIINIAGGLIGRRNVLTDPDFVSELAYMIIAVPLFFLVLRNRDLDFTLVFYLFEISILFITILQGTIWDPNNMTFTFLFCLLIMPLLILDKPWRILLLIVVMAAIFLGIDYACKDPSLFKRDLLHTVNACLMSTAAGLYTLAVRIQNIRLTDRLSNKADRDPLTGLYNRSGAEKYLAEQQPGLLIYIDLDRFKEVNDEFGHAAGDRVLMETADVLRSCFRKDDVLIRMGGDEFVVFAPGTWIKEHIQTKLFNVLKKIEGIHLHKDGTDIQMTVSMGCAYSPDGNTDIEELIKTADREMYKIKRSGKDNFRIVKMRG